MSHDIQTPFGEPHFLVLAGSRLFGIHTEESDYDYIGAIIEPQEYRLGLLNFNSQHGFEQFEFKGDDHEGTVYSLRKMVSMLAAGNPTIVTTMFADPITDYYGICTPEFRKMVVCRESGVRFQKYMESQRKALTGERKSRTKRPGLIEQHGYDTKFAGHILRLGYQGCEYLETGHITLPMPDESIVSGCALHVLEVRRGEWTVERILSEATALEARLERAYEGSALPDHPDFESLNDWLVERYRADYFS